MKKHIALQLLVTSMVTNSALGSEPTKTATFMNASIEGVIMDEYSAPMFSAAIGLEFNGEIVRQTTSDDNGFYSISGLNPGLYLLRVRYMGYHEYRKEVYLSMDRIAFEDVMMMPHAIIMDTATITWYDNRPVIDIGDPAPGPEWTPEEIEHFPGTIALSPLEFTQGLHVQDSGDPVVPMGSPSRTVSYYVDDIQVPAGFDLPTGALEGIKVLLTGIPARYGDVMGAVIVLTTKTL